MGMWLAKSVLMAPVTNAPAPRISPSTPTAGLDGVSGNPSSFLKVGDSGAQVAALQKMLKSAGCDPGPTDGKFGEQTLKALRAFQKSQGVTVDGVVGPETKAALLNPKAPRSQAARPSDVFETTPRAPVANAPRTAPTPGDVVMTARSELGRNAQDVKLGSDAIGKAMRDDVSNWKCCANFVGASLRAAGQITDRDLSASVDGLVGKLQKTGNFTQSNRLEDAQPGDVVAFDHAHVMICTGRDPKTNQPTFIGSNNDNADGSQKISEGPLRKWFGANSKQLQAWTQNVVVMHYAPR